VESGAGTESYYKLQCQQADEHKLSKRQEKLSSRERKGQTELMRAEAIV